MNPLDLLRDRAYGVSQTLLSAWAQRRYREDFAEVERFCLFVGYPRSGHSVVGAVIDAHRHAVISHELDVTTYVMAGCSRDELYSRILARAYWFHLRGSRTNYSYRVPNQWQGRFESLRVVGDKRGGAVTRCLAEHPEFLERVRRLVGVPLRLVHVVRNPFDNIAAISLWHGLSLADSADYYFAHCRTTSMLGGLCEPGELLTFRHEEMLDDPDTALSALCGFLGLEGDAGYAESCRRLLFSAPTLTRRTVAWTPELIAQIEKRAAVHPHLEGYAFEVAGREERRSPS